MKHCITTAVLTTTLWACGPRIGAGLSRDCTPTDTRCAGSFVEVCNADRRWAPAADCASVAGANQPAWQCCPVPADELGRAGHACLPPDIHCGKEN